MTWFLHSILLLLSLFIIHSNSQAIESRDKRVKGCLIEIIVDPFFHKHLSNINLQRSPLEIRRIILDLVGNHIRYANNVLRETLFDPYLTYKLILKRIKILNERNCFWKGLNYCDFESITSAGEYLNRHSSVPHDDVCLSFVFTYKHFRDGNLGLAWTAHPLSKGGICDLFSLQDNGQLSKDNFKSLNTGLITFQYNFNNIPLEVTQIAFIHEIGHSFGSLHDDDGECLLSLMGGHYIMHPRAALDSTQKLLHPTFSPCSIRNISSIVGNMIVDRGRSKDCFIDAIPISICGNGLVEGWEECDCGENETDCDNESCCEFATCKLKEGFQCSPSEGSCCHQNCTLKNQGTSCATETDCQFNSICDGANPRCPQSQFKADGTECSKGSRVCSDGFCSQSICAKFNMIPCLPIKTENECEIHCKPLKGNQNECQRTSLMKSLFLKSVFFPVNSGCDLGNNKGNESVSLGFCSSSGQCQEYPEVEQWSLSVGIGIFVLGYVILTFLGIFIYCRYWKGRTIK